MKAEEYWIALTNNNNHDAAKPSSLLVPPVSTGRPSRSQSQKGPSKVTSVCLNCKCTSCLSCY